MKDSNSTAHMKKQRKQDAKKSLKNLTADLEKNIKKEESKGKNTVKSTKFLLRPKVPTNLKSNSVADDGMGQNGQIKQDGTKKRKAADFHQKGNKGGMKMQQSKKQKFNLIEDLKLTWNKVRSKTITEEERQTLLKPMLAKIHGQVSQVTLRHDASRAVQCLLQFGNADQRQKVLEELIPKVVEVAKTPYGHFTVLKAVTYCLDIADQKKIVSALSNHFVALGTNVIGARTVESVLQLYPSKLTKSLKSEFYGKKFSVLMEEPPKDLRSLIEHNTAKTSALLDHMRDLVQRFVDKGLLAFTYVHNLIWEYVQEISNTGDSAATNAARIEDLIKQLVDSIPKLMTTKCGAKVSCFLISHGGAKERKRILKALKGNVLESLFHESAHLVIMRLIDVTDDTVNVQKTLLEEIRSVNPVEKYSASGELIGTPYPPLVSVAKNRFGKKFLLRLLSPSKRHLEPDEEFLFYSDVSTSKKSALARRKEHLTYLQAPLLHVCHKYMTDLARCQNGGARVLEEVGTH